MLKTVFVLTVAGLVIVECATFPSDKISQCVERVRSDFETMQKSTKIKVNEKLMESSSLNDSSHAIIKLSVSKTDLQLPKLNISFINLLLLDATYNGLEKIDDIGHETFPSLRLFNASFNALSSVKSYVFSHLKEIEILDFSHNCFETFHYDRVFLRHENLKKLHLNDNLLYSIQSTFKEPRAMSLNFLDFSNNFVTEFSNYDIQIRHLNMNNNSLRHVFIYHAQNMILNAQNNQLEHFFAPRGTFNSLNLSNNSFEYLSNVEIEEATVLNLSNNFLGLWAAEKSSEYDEVEVGSGDLDLEPDKSAVRLMFQTRIGIRAEVVNLQNNFIDSLNELKHFKNCKEINLENNQLQNIRPQQFVSLFPNLERVKLAKNPLTKIDLEKFKDSKSFRIDFILKSVTSKPRPIQPLLPTLPLIKINLPTLPPVRLHPTSIKTEKTVEIINSTESSPPMTSKVPQADSTTQMKSIIVTTEAQRSTETDGNVQGEIFDDEKSSSEWTLALLLATIIVSSIIIMVYINRQRKAHNIYREFRNEAENTL